MDFYVKMLMKKYPGKRSIYNALFLICEILLVISLIIQGENKNIFSIGSGASLNILGIFYVLLFPIPGGPIVTGFALIGSIQNILFYIKFGDPYYATVSFFLFSNSITCLLLSIFSYRNRTRQFNLEVLSRNDGLTGVWNHRTFQEHLPSIFHESKNQSLPLSLALIDIDNFKLINDYFGHQTGDLILKEVTQLIKKTVRDNDCIYRYGGDEFVIIFRNTKTYEASTVCNRIIEESQEHQIESIHDSIHNYQLTLSVGISGYPEFCQNYKSIVHQADKAMYESKYMGKNQSTVYNEILEMEAMEPDGEKSYVKSLLRLIDSKDHYTYGHSVRVSDICRDFGKYLGLEKQEVLELRTAGLLHDLGKLKIPEVLLQKTTYLTDEEIVVFSFHPENSAAIVQSFLNSLHVIKGISEHHEKFDGSGYPKHIKREEISYYGRILAIVDSYDAMRTDRGYSPAMDLEVTLGEIRACSGTQFDPDIADRFISFIQSQAHQYHKNGNIKEVVSLES